MSEPTDSPTDSPTDGPTDTPSGTGRDCDHDWQTVNHDENREIRKCTKCGELQRV